MKLKIVDTGYEHFNGYFGMIEFKNGVSVRDVSPIESNLVSAIVRTHWIDDGNDVGRAEYRTTSFNPSATVEPSRSVPEQAPEAPKQKELKYSREDLEAIADTKGLNGLREIGAEYGVKSTSIAKLIDAIIEAQN